MVDVSAIASALSALKAAKDIAQTMVGLRDDATFNQKLIEFQSKLIDANNAAFAAQDERAALLNEIERLNKQISSLDSWETEKQRYRLTQLAPGTNVYMVTDEARAAEPPHCICPNCYEDGKKSILHIMKDHTGTAHITCPKCKTKLQCWGEGQDFPLKLD
jgi:hypothetical protein